MIKRVGFQIVQVYYYSKPLAIEEYEEFLKERPYGDMDAIISAVRR